MQGQKRIVDKKNPQKFSLVDRNKKYQNEKITEPYPAGVERRSDDRSELRREEE